MNKIIDKLFKGIDYLTGILTGCMVLFVFLNVVLRMIFNSGLTWSEEVSRYLFVFVTYIGAISAMHSNGHFGVDTLVTRVKPKLQLTFYLISQVIIAILMSILIHGSLKMVIQSKASVTAALSIPYSFLYSAGILTGASIALIAVMHIIYAIKNPGEIATLVCMHESDEDEAVQEALDEAAALSDEEYMKQLNKGGK